MSVAGAAGPFCPDRCSGFDLGNRPESRKGEIANAQVCCHLVRKVQAIATLHGSGRQRLRIDEGRLAPGRGASPSVGTSLSVPASSRALSSKDAAFPGTGPADDAEDVEDADTEGISAKRGTRR